MKIHWILLGCMAFVLSSCATNSGYYRESVYVGSPIYYTTTPSVYYYPSQRYYYSPYPVYGWTWGWGSSGYGYWYNGERHHH